MQHQVVCDTAIDEILRESDCNAHGLPFGRGLALLLPRPGLSCSSLLGRPRFSLASSLLRHRFHGKALGRFLLGRFSALLLSFARRRTLAPLSHG